MQRIPRVVGHMNLEASADRRTPDLNDIRRFRGFFRPARGVSFLLLDGQGAIFSERSQQIYALNETAAYIWCRFEEHVGVDALSVELTRSGLPPHAAKQYIWKIFENWLKLGLVEPNHAPMFDHARFPPRLTFNLRIAGFNASVHCANAGVVDLMSVFDQNRVLIEDSADVFHLGEIEGFIEVFHNERLVICCEPDELVPLIKAYFTEQILAARSRDVAFHAASIVSKGRNLLLSGRPGAGKTTLALCLASRPGFDCAGDDIALIAENGRAAAVPFPFGVKAGAWNIVNRFRADLDGAPIHRRSDGKRVRFLKPQAILNDEYPVGWVVFIRRKRGAATLEPLQPLEAMGRLMESSYMAGGRLDIVSCHSLKRMIGNARSFELSYSDVVEAGDVMVRLCDD